MSNSSSEMFKTALDELGAVLARVDGDRIDAACGMLVGARQIVVYGCGREALQVKGFAMRLYHLGLPVSVVGDMTTPPVGQGDVLLVSSGPGETSTVLTLMRIAREAGATVLLLTAQAGGSAAGLADLTLLIPAQNHGRRPGAAKDVGAADGLGVRGRVVRAVRDHGAETQGDDRGVAGSHARPPHQHGIDHAL